MIEVSGGTHKYRDEQAFTFKVRKNGSVKFFTFPFRNDSDVHHIISESMKEVTKALNKL